MDLKVFDGQDKSELSMIEVAHAILAQHGETMAFADLVNEIQQYLGKSDEEIRDRISQFYTDLNIDGSFISLGNNTWGLRAWYPFDSIDEATVGENDDDEDDDEKNRRKKHHRVNAFLADDNSDDVIDYENDDPEDDDLDDDQSTGDDFGEDNYDDESDANNGADSSDIESQLSELNNGDDDDDDDDDDE